MIGNNFDHSHNFMDLFIYNTTKFSEVGLAQACL